MSQLSCKVSEKTGAVMVMGLQRFPITLYAEQWDKLLDDATVKGLKAFIAKKRSEKKADGSPVLSVKAATESKTGTVALG